MDKWFEHYASIGNMYTKIVYPVYSKFNLTYMEFSILMFLTNNPQHDTAAEIVKYLHFTKSHVSTSVQSLKERGFIVGEYQGQNRRSIHLRVLEAASEVIEEGLEAQKYFKQALYQDFTEEDFKMYFSLMQRIEKNVEVFNQKQKEK